MELSSRHTITKKLENGNTFIPILIDDAIVSLSAILVDDAYYNYIISGKKIVNGFSVVGIEHLIPLKAKAWLNLTERKEKQEKVDSYDIRKHKNDVFRLNRLLSLESRVSLPHTIKDDLSLFLNRIENESVDLKNLGYSSSNYDEILNNIKTIYNIIP